MQGFSGGIDFHFHDVFWGDPKRREIVKKTAVILSASADFFYSSIMRRLLLGDICTETKKGEFKAFQMPREYFTLVGFCNRTDVLAHNDIMINNKYTTEEMEWALSDSQTGIRVQHLRS